MNILEGPSKVAQSKEMMAYFDELDQVGGFPSISRFLEIIIEDTDKKLEGSDLGARLLYNDGNPELLVNVGVSLEPEFDLDLDLGPALENIGLDMTASATVTVAGDFRLSGVLGVDINKMFDASEIVGFPAELRHTGPLSSSARPAPQSRSLRNSRRRGSACPRSQCRPNRRSGGACP